MATFDPVLGAMPGALRVTLTPGTRDHGATRWAGDSSTHQWATPSLIS